MKNIFIIALVLMTYSIEAQQCDYALAHLFEIENNYTDTDGIIYKIDNIAMDSLLKLSKKEYKIVYFYAYWCEGCRIFTPKLINFVRKNKNKFDLYMVTFDQYNRIPFIYQYLKKEKINFPTYLVGEEYYKTRRKWKRFFLFLNKLYPDYDKKVIGYGLYILFDKNLKVIYDASEHPGMKLQFLQKLVAG